VDNTFSSTLSNHFQKL